MSAVNPISGGVPTLKTGQAHVHPAPLSGSAYSALELMPDDRSVVMLDQTLLPRLEKYELLSNVSQMAEAILQMKVRGAPALGIAAAYGMVLCASAVTGDTAKFVSAMQAAEELLRGTRPTARNLGWALDRIMSVVPQVAPLMPRDRMVRIADVARGLHEAEVLACRKLSALGAELVPDGATILTHCNAGALATGGYGTALGVIRAARAQGKQIKVIACETRPLLQGSRLTAWELVREQIPVEVITDGMAGALFGAGAIDLVIVGADRIARNGDVVNKIGTYGLACLAHMHGVPFDVAAPWSTVDLTCEDGSRVPIERRGDAEVTHMRTHEAEVLVVAEGARVQNPAFDVTPARLVRAIHTERGTLQPVTEGALLGLSTLPGR